MLKVTSLEKQFKAIQLERAALAKLQEDRDRADAAARIADISAGKIAALRCKRAEVVGRAFIASSDADVKSIDAEIEAAQQAGAAAAAAAHAASCARVLLDTEITASQARLVQLRRVHIEQAIELVHGASEAILDAYEAAAQKLLDLVAEADAAARICLHVERLLTGRPMRGVWDFVPRAIIERLELPVKADGAWMPANVRIATRDRAAEAFEASKSALVGVGVDWEAEAIAPPAPEKITRAEPRPVTITQIGGSQTVATIPDGEEGWRPGLVESRVS